MSIKKLPILASLQKKIGYSLAWLPLSPNQITLLALAFALIAFFFASLHQPLLSLLLFILAGATDALDGAVARAKKQVTSRGAFIDGMTDRLVEFLFIMSFFFYPLPPFILPAGFLLIIYLFFGSAMTGFATAYAEHRHVADSRKIAAQPGIMPRAERLLLLFAALALVPIYPILASLLLFAGAVLCFITFCQRFWYFSN